MTNMLLNLLVNKRNYSYGDIPSDYSFSFQDPCTPSAIAIQDLYWNISIILFDVLVFVSILLLITLVLFRKQEKDGGIGRQIIGRLNENVTSGNSVSSFNESTLFEFFITGFSSFLLLFIGIPGIAALYSLEESLTPVLNIKVLGKQWQWSYEYSDYTNLETGKTISFDSAPVLASDSDENPLFNLLSVDNNLVVPVNLPINFVVTSTDVIHSWAVPSAGIKMDAVPGRLNSFTTVFNRTGSFYGQCSELCGQGHALMPICVKVVSSDDYVSFIKNQLKEI